MSLRSMNASVGWIAALGLCAPLAMAGPVPFGPELVVNGDAETGTIAGWTSTGVEPVSSAGPGVLGLPMGVTTGMFCFTGALGDPTQTMTQVVNLSGYASAIDAGRVRVSLGAVVQAATAGGFTDTASIEFQFLNGGGGTLSGFSFADNDAPEGVFDWEVFSQITLAPTGTRSVRIRLTTSRTIGASTDGYFDNVSVRVACASSCTGDASGDLSVGLPDIAAIVNCWAMPAACNLCADLDGSGEIGLGDIAVAIGNWGANCP